MKTIREPLSVIVIGASGDLARTKIYPALFALYCQDLLPPDFRIVGFARSRFTREAFRSRIEERLTCRYSPDASCATRMSEFLSRCFYHSGRYESSDSFLDLYSALRDVEPPDPPNRLYYLAVPPSIFLDVARALGDAGLVNCGVRRPWSRVVIEKPFGRDRASSDHLTAELARVFSEDQTFRMDHYLGKEVIQNLLVLRFANVIFEPVWNSRFIREVRISWKENLGVEGRGYFDAYGIIRDVMQNHLLQILALTAMEPPTALGAREIGNEKVKVLRCVPPATLNDLAIGQYAAGVLGRSRKPGYLEDDAVPDGSLTPTFAAAVLRVENPRWHGVPFLVSAGKGLDTRRTEVRILFRDLPAKMFCHIANCPDPNRLVIRVQPDESLYFSLANKVPGLGMTLASRNLDLKYKAAFREQIPDAYESLLMEVLRGEKTLFIRRDELAAAWDVFTPVLHEIEERRLPPEPYPFGSTGPAGARSLAARRGFAPEDDPASATTEHGNPAGETRVTEDAP